MKECLNFSLSVYGKQCNITLIYRSPSQSSGDFDTFSWNSELLLVYIANRNSFVSITTGDFNKRPNNWCSSDKTTCEPKKSESLTSQCRFRQIISDPTHILETLVWSLNLIISLITSLRTYVKKENICIFKKDFPLMKTKIGIH